MSTKTFQIRPLIESDRDWVVGLLREHWSSVVMVTKGRLFDASILPGFTAMQGDIPAGLVTYRIENDQCEICTINSLVEGAGIGSALVADVRDTASGAGCKRIWLITTNDNTAALRFWQKQGFSISAVFPNAVEQARRLKPEIPLIGNDGIPIRDEIELEMIL